MASAPGQSSAQQEPVCYNCGLKGHWVVACPEPTREVPAGLKRWQSQHHDQAQRPERHNAGPDRKPPVVTRYGPPPAYTPPAAQYGQPPPPPYPPAGSPPGQGPYPPPQYPPAPQQPPFYGSGYPPPLPPSQPQYGSYPVPPPAPPPPPFNQHHAPPHHPFYGPPQPGSQYPPAQPPPPPGYYNAPQPPYPPAPYHPPPYPPQPNYQVPPYPPSGPPPPPPGYHQAPYPPPHYPPNPAQGYPPVPLPPPPIPPPPPASYQQDNNWSQPPPPNASQPPRHQRGKKKVRDRRLSSKTKGQKGTDRQRSSPVVKSVLPDGEAVPSIEPNVGAHLQDEPEPGEVAEDGNELDTYDDWSVEVEKHFEVVFAEAAGKAADPVGIPLPYKYTDDPTIPPAYNATCIKSEFFDEDVLDQFTLPVQKSRGWPLLLSDPAFKRYPGMVNRTFDGFDELVYLTYEVPARHPEGAPVKLPPKFRIDRQAVEKAYQRQRFLGGETSPKQARPHDRDRRPFSQVTNDRDNDYRRRQDNNNNNNNNRSFNRTPNNRPVKRGFDDSRHPDNRDIKRHRRSPSHHDTPPSAGSRGPNTHRSPPARPDYERGAWSPQADEGRFDRVEKRRHSVERRGETGRSSSRRRDRSNERQTGKSANPRHDSGYHSGQSPDKSRRHANQDEDRRPRRRSRSRGRSYSRGRSRSGSHEGRASRASSATASDDRSRSSSPLTAMDYELLGLSRPKAKASIAGVGKKLIKRQMKVSAAYGRRW